MLYYAEDVNIVTEIPDILTQTGINDKIILKKVNKI